MQHSFHISRRSFLHHCTTLAATAGLPLWFVQRELSAAEPAKKIASPNERCGIGLIGCGGMGQATRDATRFGDVLAVCDVDQGHAEAAAHKLADNGRTPAAYGDFRKLLGATTFTPSCKPRPIIGTRWSTWRPPRPRRTCMVKNRSRSPSTKAAM